MGSLLAVMVLGWTAADASARPRKERPTRKTADVKKADPKKVQEQLTRKRKELEGSVWAVTGKGADQAAASFTDNILFRDGHFSAAGFQQEGFAPTNYTLSVGEAGVVVFETMQTSEKNGTVFWRGELSPDGVSCQGMFSHVRVDQTAQDTYFTGKKITEKPEGA